MHNFEDSQEFTLQYFVEADFKDEYMASNQTA